MKIFGTDKGIIMNLKHLTLALSLAFTAFITLPVLAADSVVQDLATGDWVFTVNDTETNEQRVWRYAPRNQFQAKLHQTLRWTGSQFEYRYRLQNDRKSKQDIAYLWIEESRMQMTGLPKKDSRQYEEFATTADWVTAGHQNSVALEAYKTQYISKPTGWRSSINIDKDNIGRKFGWFPKVNMQSSAPTKYLEPGQTLHSAYILRPELPGVGLAGMKGNTKQRGRAQGLPDTGPLADAWDVIEATDGKVIPVLVPAVAIPAPYSNLQLAKNLRDEMTSWPKLGVASQEVIDRLNRQFDVLLPALELNSKDAARGAIRAMLEEIFNHHENFDHRKLEEDDEDHITQPIPMKEEYRRQLRVKEDAQDQGAQNAKIHRVAARALGINLMYLLTRIEMARY